MYAKVITAFGQEPDDSYKSICVREKKILLLISSNQQRNKIRGSFKYIETSKEKLSSEEIRSKPWEIQLI